jgi:hypothetical protein
MRGARAVRGWSLILLAGWLVACASETSRAPAVTVPITDFKSVAGVWEGAWEGPTDRTDSDWLKLTIRPDGRWEAESFRMIGVFRSSGQLTLSGGMITFQGERGGTGSASLVESGDKRWLNLQAVTSRGIHVTARMTPSGN